jgi:hypothetical protein
LGKEHILCTHSRRLVFHAEWGARRIASLLHNLIMVLSHQVCDATLELVLDLCSHNVIEPLVSYLAVGGCKYEATFGIVPILFTVLPSLGFFALLVICAKFLLDDF